MRKKADKPLRALPPAAAMMIVITLIFIFAGCGGERSRDSGGPKGLEYPMVENFKDVNSASEKAWFRIRAPEYTMGGELKNVTFVRVSPDRKYADIIYSNNLTITETPAVKDKGFKNAMAEHASCVEVTPENLRTIEEPYPVDIAGHKGILWMNKDGVFLEEREDTGVPLFHNPYLVWWDKYLEYRLSVDEPELFREDPEAGVKELIKIAESMY